jgi:hypothetical protein
MNKYLITIVAIIIAGFVSFIVWYLAINRTSETATQTLLKIIIGLFTISILICFDILSPGKVETKEVKLLMLINKTGEVDGFVNELQKTGSEHSKGYQEINNVIVFTPRKNKDNTKQYKLDSDHLDIVEMATFFWLSTRNRAHWDVQNKYFEGISGGGGNQRKSMGAENKPLKLDDKKLAEILERNIFQADGGYLPWMFLPSGSKMTTERTELSRIIKISNKYIDEFKIEITHVGHGGLLWTDLGENIKKYKLGKDINESWYTSHFIINLSVKYNRLRKGSPETKKQIAWINSIMEDYYNDFDWRLIKKDLEKYYSLNNISH